ncbi:MAG TPA: LemA family protein, partial [candidate division WWE3 bacterium]|nr:LemA family protein [candidate division WWE3 bacterium]
MNKLLLVLLGFAAFTILYLANFYNSLVRLQEEVNNQWAQVETQYQRRYDLIPNLVETVKGVAGQEQKVFGDIAEARTRYAGAQNPQERVDAANQLETALGRLLVIVENYPQLKSSESFNTLMAQLEGTENRISVERKRYNEKV